MVTWIFASRLRPFGQIFNAPPEFWKTLNLRVSFTATFTTPEINRCVSVADDGVPTRAPKNELACVPADVEFFSSHKYRVPAAFPSIAIVTDTAYNPAVLIVIVSEPADPIVSVSQSSTVHVINVGVLFAKDALACLHIPIDGGTTPELLRNEITSFAITFQAAAVATSPAANT